MISSPIKEGGRTEVVLLEKAVVRYEVSKIIIVRRVRSGSRKVIQITYMYR